MEAIALLAFSYDHEIRAVLFKNNIMFTVK